ncbi:MAG: AbrB/MazE/SpoVT family DNA-binding domain-containing protein [Candidatus Latescibacter sp.]|nr:AbrB/MazE/SpoVT family DNA-binding domain-containing protein [Candidatus Latescibacter sp.]
MILTVQNRGTITISRELRKKIGIAPGDPLEASVEGGRLILTPVVVVPRTLILSESGKRLEEEVDQEIKDGKVRAFECLDDMEKYLEE